LKPIYKETSDPIEWLRRCFWCKHKEFKASFVIDPYAEVCDLGPGDLDCFEYLKYHLNEMYEELNPPGYEWRYICFKKGRKHEPFHPDEKTQIKEKSSYKELANKIGECSELLQEKKDLTPVEKLKRKNRYLKRNKGEENNKKEFNYNKNRMSMKP